jgi:hypothetical protein
MHISALTSGVETLPTLMFANQRSQPPLREIAAQGGSQFAFPKNLPYECANGFAIGHMPARGQLTGSCSHSMKDGRTS